MSTQVVCPQCRKCTLLRVLLVALEREVILCCDCEVIWLHPAAVGSRSWLCYASFMEQAGRLFPNDPREKLILGPLMR